MLGSGDPDGSDNLEQFAAGTSSAPHPLAITRGLADTARFQLQGEAMHATKFSILATFLSAGLTAACGSEDAGSAGTGGAAGSAGSAGSGGSSATISVFGVTGDFGSAPGSGVVTAGVEVCLLDQAEAPCVTSDNLGQYLLAGVPSNSAVAVRYAKAGFVPTIEPMTTRTDDLQVGVRLISEADAAALAGVLGFTYPLGDTGVLAFEANGLYSGATATLDPAGGVGPFYLGDNGVPSATLTATTGWHGGFFVNVPPGEVDVTIAIPGRTCTKNVFGWPSTTGTGRATVVAGAVVAVAAECE